jgi:3-isopropylmalate dehydrogenase
VVAGLDILIVRELTGDIYFGSRKGIRKKGAEREGFDTMLYSEARSGASRASASRRRASAGACARSTRPTCSRPRSSGARCDSGSEALSDVELTHMYVDNCAMQLVRNPKQFDVIVTGNMFGDILSDEASMLTGSIGMLPSAALDENGKGLYEPIHGTAPDIAGKGSPIRSRRSFPRR